MMPTPTLTRGPTGNCAIIQTVTTGSDPYGNNSHYAGAMLDPHIRNGTVYVSERDNASVYSDLINSSSSWHDLWSVDAIPVSWGGSGTPPSAGAASYYVFNFAAWASNTTRDLSGHNRAGSHCEEYYKLTGLASVPNPGSPTQPYLRAFFQSNDINGSGASPFQGVHGTASGSCDNMGAGGASDAFVFSGLFYADLGSTLAGTTTFAGDHYTQFYPSNPLPSGMSNCLTPHNSVRCYGEFPWIFQDLTRIMFTGNLTARQGVIDTCVLTLGGCMENYTDEAIQGLINTDYSQSPAAMTLITAKPLTNYNILGSNACGQILSAANTPSNCGISGATPYFGGCGHLDVDEQNQVVTCSAQTDVQDMFGNYQRQTMIVPLAVSTLNPAVQMLGGVSIVGGVHAVSQ